MAEQDESFRDRISTISEEGKRQWVFPKKPSGKYYNARTILSWFLIAFLFAGPWIRIGGQPLLLINVLERKFVILGQIFWPQDFHLFGLAMITMVVFIIVFTVAFGRLFCGWVCPQTIFMEMVFRKIEYLIEGDYKQQQKLAKMPWNAEKIRKRVLKNGIFFLLSFAIANTFLAYIIGSENLLAIQVDNPMNHVAGLAGIVVFSAIFFGVFAQFREQVCTIACPYGRLQGVLLDKKSIIVAYDYKRGENRAKFRKNEDRTEVGKGDCIDCNQCVNVCPTGIDIRNGTQLECINCTACIDACDTMMTSVNQPTGLIRYASEENIAEGKPFKFNTRLIAYSIVLTGLLTLLVTLLVTRSDVETTILRTPGILYQKNDDGTISNLYNYKIVNKTNNDFQLQLELETNNGYIKFVGDSNITISKMAVSEGAMFVNLPREELNGIKTKISIKVLQDGKEIEEVTTNFMGPNN